MIINLPLETQVYILQLCSREDLAALARTHSTLRDVAEYVLYRHINFSIGPKMFSLYHGDRKPLSVEDFVSLVHTLTTNSRKALIVKKVYFEVEYYGIREEVCPGLFQFSKALKNMSNLVDLRVKYLGAYSDKSQERISQVIRCVLAVITVVP